jgi:plasmid replication initiation protein
MTLVNIEDSNPYLKKHIFAIHSTNNITLLQRKIYNALLFNASYLQTDQKLYTINITELSDIIGYDSKDFKTIKNSIKGLTKIVIDWNVIDEQSSGEVIENTSPFLSGVSFKKNICTYEYSEILKQLLLCPLIYGKIYLNIQAKLTTSSGLALYENCNRYRDLNATPWLNMDVLGKLLGFNSKQIPYKRIKARYINKAIQDVNTHTDLDVDLIEQKNGKSVEKVKFKIKKNVNTLVKSEEMMAGDELEVFKLLKKYGFSYKDSVEITKNYCTNEITSAIEYVLNQSSYKEGKVKNVSGYIVKTLKNNYKENLSSKEIINEERKEKDKKHREQEELLKKQDQEYNIYLLEITNKIKDKYAGSEMIDILNQFREHLKIKNPFLFKWSNEYNDDSFNNKAIDSLFNNYLRTNYALDGIEILDKNSYFSQEVKSEISIN